MSEEASIRLPDPAGLVVSNSPHVHSGQSTAKIMFAVVAALLPAVLAGVWYFGLAAVETLLLCTVACVAVEEGWNKLTGHAPTWKDGSALITGLLLGMNLNAGVPWWVCLVGAMLAIVLGKQLFGGLGHNPFNPALVARVGLLIGFPGIMTTWDNPHAGRFVADAVTGATPLGEGVKNGVFSLGQLLTGAVGGCIGETSVVALLIGGAVLIAFKLIKWEVPAAFVATVFLVTAIPYELQLHGVNVLRNGAVAHSPVYHVLSGGLLLGAFFMATDMVTSPMTRKGAVVFGVGCGLMTALIRLWGSYPEGVSFSILFMNALTPLIDRVCIRKPFGYVAPEKKEAKDNG